MRWRRYLALLAQQLRLSFALAMQYRLDFVLKGVMAVFWVGITLLPLAAVFTHRQTVAGWTHAEALVLLGWFLLLKALLDGGVTPSLGAVVEGVRTGALDFVLLKPADAQFLVSTARFEPWRAVDALAGLAVIVYAFTQLGHAPPAAGLAVAAVLLVVAVALLYSVWILVVAASFWVVKVDNLSYLLNSLFDVGRWPVSFLPRALRLTFTFVFPLALMVTYPAEALLGRLHTRTAALAVLGGVAFTWLARLVWTRAIRSYTSASS